MKTLHQNRKNIKNWKLWLIVINAFFIMHFSCFHKTALSEVQISATKSLGITGGSTKIALSNKTNIELNVAPNTFENNIGIKLSESNVMPYNVDIIGLFSVDLKNQKAFKLKRPFEVSVVPEKGINLSRKDKIQVYILETKKSGKQYWDRFFDFTIDTSNNAINLLILKAGTYKIQYSKIKVGIGHEEKYDRVTKYGVDKTQATGFFKLMSPNKVGSDSIFQLYFDGSGEDVYFIIKDEDENDLWDGSNENEITTIKATGWNQFTVAGKNFKNYSTEEESTGKYKIICYDQDIGFDDELWSAWFIRDHESIGGEGEISDLLDTYAPYVFYGNHKKSQEFKETSKNLWDYGDEFKDGEIYFPIDIRDLVTYFAPNFYTVESNEFIDGFNVSVGRKTSVMGNLDYEYTLKDKNIIEKTSSGSINFALFNDVSLEYGLTRKWKPFLTEYDPEYDLVEFEGTEDEPYMAGINSSTSYPDKNTSYFSISKSKIYGTAYKYKYEGKDREYIFLQYYFYYPFDPKNGDDWLGISEFISRHAGDRERLVVILEKNGINIIDSTPIGAYFFHHLNCQKFSYYGDDLNDDQKKFSWNDNKESPGAYVKWINVNKTDNHPHIYIAQGSHGIYFRPGSYTVDVPYEKALKEYAGGQEEKIYSTKNGNLVYLPRLSQIDTINENTEFSFLLFSGPVAETSREKVVDYLSCKDLKIYFPPYDDVWYAVHKYCFNDNGEFEPKNNVSDDLAKLKGTVSIEHTLTPPSKTNVSQGGSLGPFTVKETNSSSSYYSFYAQPYIIKPDGTTVNFKQVSTGLDAGKSRTHYHYLSIPSWSELGVFTFGVKITDTDGNLIDDDSFEFTVASSTAYASKRSDRKLKRLLSNPEAQVMEEDGWKVIIVPERNR